MDIDDRIQYAIEHTEVLRSPKQRLSTFGFTNMYYYLLTEPVYSELLSKMEETVVREGRVITEKPKIVTPYYLVNIFEGFQHGKEYAEFILRKYGANEPGLLYKYRNEPSEVNIVSSPLNEVIVTLNQRIDQKGDPLSVIIKGVGEMWDVSLMKFIHDVTRGSLSSNVTELGMRGLLDIDQAGVPRQTRLLIEQLFEEVREDRNKAPELEAELRSWGLFDEYEDRFLKLFKK
jgi:hypothetical protein